MLFILLTETEIGLPFTLSSEFFRRRHRNCIDPYLTEKGIMLPLGSVEECLNYTADINELLTDAAKHKHVNSEAYVWIRITKEKSVTALRIVVNQTLNDCNDDELPIVVTQWSPVINGITLLKYHNSDAMRVLAGFVDASQDKDKITKFVRENHPDDIFDIDWYNINYLLSKIKQKYD